MRQKFGIFSNRSGTRLCAVFLILALLLTTFGGFSALAEENGTPPVSTEEQAGFFQEAGDEALPPAQEGAGEARDASESDPGASDGDASPDDENAPLATVDAALLAEILDGLATYFENSAIDWVSVPMAVYGRGDDVAGETILNAARGALLSGTTPMITLERHAIELTALGVDVSRVYGGSEGVYLSFLEHILAERTLNAINDAIHALILLDCGAYDDTAYSIGHADLIDFILERKLTPASGQAAWGLSDPDVDMTAMAIIALAPYYLDGGLYAEKADEVEQAVIDGLSYLSSKQLANGSYAGFFAPANSSSTAMVLVALASLGMDPDDRDGAFAKDGNSVLAGLMTFQTEEGLFGHTDSAGANVQGSEQAFRALVAYHGFLSAGGAYHLYHFGAQTGDGTALTGEYNPDQPGPVDPSAPKTVTVRAENLYAGTTVLPETSVSVSGTHLDALRAALAAIGEDPDEALGMTDSGWGPYVSSILGVAEDESIGAAWMYAINEGNAFEGLGVSAVSQGDRLTLYYSNYFGAVELAKFDKATAQVRPGESVALTLTSVDSWGMAPDYIPLVGATVYAVDAAGDPTGAEAVTDAEGKATLTFPSAGQYTVRAERAGEFNATDVVSPLCKVTVTSGGYTPPVSSNKISVSFTLQGMNDSGAEETWIPRKTLSGVPDDSTVGDVIIQALAGTGYTQVGAANGYLSAVTTPGGFTLAEMHGDWPLSGWLYRVNNGLPSRGVNDYTPMNGDHILLYFTKDWTKDPDAGKYTESGGSGSTVAPTPENTGLEVLLTPELTVIDGVASLSVSADQLHDAIAKAAAAHPAQTGFVLTVDGSGGAAATVTLDPAVFAAAGASLRVVLSDGAEILYSADLLRQMSETTDGVFTFEITLGSVTLDFTRSGAAADWRDFKHPILLRLAGDALMINTKTGKVLPRGWLADGFAFAKVYEAGTYDVGQGVLPSFLDTEGRWMDGDVVALAARGVTNGIGGGLFAPEREITRAEFTALLMRALDLDDGAGTAGHFADVSIDAYYAGAVNTARALGILPDPDAPRFFPDAAIARQDLFTMLYRAMALANILPADLSEEAPSFADGDDVSEYAATPIARLTALGLISAEDRVFPLGTATRAEAAQLIYAMLKLDRA